jgi:histidine triad (HIT) family protein
MADAGKKTLFEKIIDKEIPAQFVFEDELCVVIKDINPAAPLHLLLIAGHVARDAGFGDAFRLVVNNGAAASQSVFHLHLHVLAGRPLKWPPG